jgi:L-Ala-D/L-Glu epimerase
MPWRYETEVLALSLRDPFRIARTEGERTVTTAIVRLAPDGPAPDGPAPDGPAPDGPASGALVPDAAVPDAAAPVGLGEAFPVAYHGETPATVEAVLPMLVAELDRLATPPVDREAVAGWLAEAGPRMGAAIGGHGAAKAGLDIALHDLAGKWLGLPLWQLLGTPQIIPPTDFSIGIDAPAVVAERARRASRFPALKIKVGGPDDLATLEAVRAVYAGPIRVDANTGWQPETIEPLLPELQRLGVELVEQPFPSRALPQLRWLQERSPLPIVADESAVTIEDLDALVGVVAGVNVKLMKCGGVGPAVAMARRARELGFKVMVGCMQETSVGIAAAAAMAGLADWVDLDGNLLLAEDPFEGLELGDDLRWRLSDRPGLGLRPRTLAGGRTAVDP